MIAAIAGDIIGSVYERAGTKRTDFPLFHEEGTFTDDTVMTLAVADCILSRRPYAETLRAYGRRYPRRGYGGMFRKWLLADDMGPYQSFGNGSAMRVSPVGFACDALADVMAEAEALLVRVWIIGGDRAWVFEHAHGVRKVYVMLAMIGLRLV